MPAALQFAVVVPVAAACIQEELVDAPVLDFLTVQERQLKVMSRGSVRRYIFYILTKLTAFLGVFEEEQTDLKEKTHSSSMM